MAWDSRSRNDRVKKTINPILCGFHCQTQDPLKTTYHLNVTLDLSQLIQVGLLLPHEQLQLRLELQQRLGLKLNAIHLLCDPRLNTLQIQRFTPRENKTPFIFKTKDKSKEKKFFFFLETANFWVQKIFKLLKNFFLIFLKFWQKFLSIIFVYFLFQFIMSS